MSGGATEYIYMYIKAYQYSNRPPTMPPKPKRTSIIVAEPAVRSFPAPMVPTRSISHVHVSCGSVAMPGRLDRRGWSIAPDARLAAIVPPRVWRYRVKL